MSLLEQIKTDSLEARKAHNARRSALLTTLYAEASMLGKNDGNRDSTDEEVQKTVRKFIKSNQEALEALSGANLSETVDLLIEEQRILKTYLPPELTDEQIEEAINYASAFQGLSMKSMNLVKGRLDELYPGAYDGKRVSEALKKRIS